MRDSKGNLLKNQTLGCKELNQWEKKKKEKGQEGKRLFRNLSSTLI
jgi:hypothetical protein